MAGLVAIGLSAGSTLAAQAGACLTPPAGLVGWWPGDGNAADIVGTNHGVLAGGATANATGMVGQAFEFDGTNGYVRVPDSPVLRPGIFTLECWVRFSTLDSFGNTPLPGQQYIVFKQNSLDYAFEGFVLSKDRDPQGDVFLWEVTSAAGQLVRLDSVTTLSTGVWYYVAAVRGPDFLQLYVNGRLEAQTNVDFPQDYGAHPLFFGSSGQDYYDRKLAGTLDEVSLYNRVLSADEIAGTYKAGSAGKCKGAIGAGIITQPQSQVVAAGANVSFGVFALGTPPLRYRWQHNGTDLINGGNISGANSSLLSVLNVQPADAGDYRVIVTNSIGAVTSAVATLTVTPPGSCVGPPAGLIGWWPGDGSAADISGNNNGTLQGGATATAAGLVSQAFLLDGISGYVQIADSTALRPTNLTIEAWVLFNSLDSTGSSLAGQQYIVFRQNTSSFSFEGFVLDKERGANGDFFTFSVCSASGEYVEVDSPAMITTGTWYHLAGVRGTNFIQLYVNGQLVGQAGVSFAQDYGDYPLFFGTSGQAYWDHKLAGLLDEVSLYNRALSAGEIAAIYSAGAAGKCKGSTGPRLTAQPQSQVVAVGSNASFTVTATGTRPLSYQWLCNGAVIANGGQFSGVSTSTLAIASVQPANAGNYSVVVSNSAGAVTSAVAVLTVLLPPTITAQPQSRANAVGTTASFSAGASGSAPLSYRWQLYKASLFDGGRISGTATATLTIANVQPADGGDYSLVVSNAVGVVTSAVAVLTVIGPPVITTQPASQSMTAGANVRFTVSATGTAPLSYQWLFNGLALANGSQFSGVTSPMLAIANVQPANAGNYSVVVTNSAGTVTSAAASLSVTVAGGCLPVPAGLIGWWPGDGSAADISGNNNNGTLQGGATATAAGLVSQAFRLDGTNGYVQVANSSLLRPTNLTIEAWVLFHSLDSAGSSLAGQQYIVFRQNTRSFNFEGFVLDKERGANGDFFTFSVCSAAGQYVEVDSPAMITTGTWYHLAGVRGPNFIALYVNGQLVGQASVSFAQSYGNYPLLFGTTGQAYWDHKLAGLLDEVSLYNRALSASEIAAIYAAGSAGKCRPSRALALLLPSHPVKPQPLIESVLVTNNVAVITWNAVEGQAYRLQFKENLASAGWNEALPDVVATGPTATATHALGNSPQRFYRILLVP